MKKKLFAWIAGGTIFIVSLAKCTKAFDEIYDVLERRFSKQPAKFVSDYENPPLTDRVVVEGVVPSPGDRLERNIVIATRAADLMTLSIDRNNAYKEIITNCLNNSRPDLATPLVSKLSLSIEQDDAYKRIIAKALEVQQYELAEKIIPFLSLTIDQDNARKRLVSSKLLAR
ncbi:hypothetical protein [Humidesulfovibrio idahonensis]